MDEFKEYLALDGHNYTALMGRVKVRAWAPEAAAGIGSIDSSAVQSRLTVAPLAGSDRSGGDGG